MKLKFVAVMATGTALLASGAVQAAEAFVGPSIALGMGVGALSTELTTHQALRDMLSDSYSHVLNRADSRGFVKPVVDASYGFALTKDWVLTAGVNMDVGTLDAGETNLSYGPKTSAFLKIRNHYSAYLAPGMRLGQHWLLYGKLGYHQAKASFGEAGERPDHPAASAKLSGIGIGIGANYAFNDNLDLRMEYENIRFNSYTYKPGGTALYSVKPSMGRINLLLGYRF